MNTGSKNSNQKQKRVITPNSNISSQFQNISKLNNTNPMQFSDPNINPNVNIPMNMFGQNVANQNMFQNQQAGQLTQGDYIRNLISSDNKVRSDIKQRLNDFFNGQKELRFSDVNSKSINIKLKGIFEQVFSNKLKVISYQGINTCSFKFQVSLEGCVYSFDGMIGVKLMVVLLYNFGFVKVINMVTIAF